MTHCCLKMPWYVWRHTFTVPNPNQWWFDLEFLWQLLWSHLHCDENYTKSLWAVDCNHWPWITTQAGEHLDLVTSNHTLRLVCSEHNGRQQTTLEKWSTDNITSIVLRFIHDHDILSKIHFSGAGFIFSCKNDILKDLLLCCAAALMCAHLSTLLTPLFCRKGVSLGSSRPWYWSGRRHKRGVFTITEKAPKGRAYWLA